MKTSVCFLTFLAALGLETANATNFVEAADISGAPPNSGYTGVVGTRFGVEANDIPSGATVRVTHLGFYAGVAGQFTGADVVDFDHTVSLSGPRGYSSRGGDYSTLPVASVTVPAGNPVDASGWSWVGLPGPVDLVGGQYYTIVTTVTSGQTNDPYFDPYGGPAGSASILAPGSIFRNGTGDTYMVGRYALTSGAEAYGTSGYLGANFQFEVIAAPVITAGLPAESSVVIGGDITLSVTLNPTGIPEPTYLWEFDAAPVDGSFVTVGTDPTYTITNAGTADAGDYRITVANSHGTAQSTGNLIVDADSDDDGIPNAAETNTGVYVSPGDTGSNPNLADTDGDDLGDGEEVNNYGTDPNITDSDIDGLDDGDEVNTHGTIPSDLDTDDDGLEDGEEVLTYLTLPLVRDTDEDGYTDGYEVDILLTDPLSATAPGGANPPAIGVAFNNQHGEQTGYPLTPQTFAGVSSVGQKNWNRTIPLAFGLNGSEADIQQPSPGGLVDSAGSPTTMTMSYSAAGAWSDLNEQETAYGHLYNAFLYNDSTSPDVTINLEGIPYATFDVYVYMGADFNGRTGFVSSGTQTYSFTSASNATSAGGLADYVESTDPSGFPQANYCVFHFATGSSFSFKVSRGSNNVGLFGFQVVETTLPPGYAGWSTVNAGGQDESLDFDGDGVANGVEYFMGESGSSFTSNPQLANGSITWSKDATAGASYEVQTSTTLAAEGSPGGWTTVTTGVVDSGTSVVFTPPSGSPKLFVRLKVSIP